MYLGKELPIYIHIFICMNGENSFEPKTLKIARRQDHKLSLCRRILKGGSVIPCDVFSPAVGRRDGFQLKQPIVQTNYHAQSFFVTLELDSGKDC